ncbi:MAG: hypothetical protein HYR70_04500 [Chloroflexi bacterium]|nr:hypothetical protein [Chloroflexota bacterium]MBI3340817.1 hypothetical protein [Chloroflexota bacterium]
MSIQCQYAAPLQTFLGAGWHWLTDWFSAELNLPVVSPKEQPKASAK